MSHLCDFYYYGYNFEQRIIIEPLSALGPVVTAGYYVWMHDPAFPNRTEEEFFTLGEAELPVVGAYANGLFETCERVNAYLNNMSIDDYFEAMRPGVKFKLNHMAFWMRYVRAGQREGFYGDESVLKYCPIEEGWGEDYRFDPTYENLLLAYNYLEDRITQFEHLHEKWLQR
ncbi:hypothetical protein J5500_01650 [Candidatus Saccharibacteria bacterium]|nr:hypothetical protein [Candidatus Saccharibacteria bacterium]